MVGLYCTRHILAFGPDVMYTCRMLGYCIMCHCVTLTLETKVMGHGLDVLLVRSTEAPINVALA